VQNPAQAGRIVPDTNAAEVGRIAASATTTTAMAPSDESARKMQIRKGKTLSRELKAL